MLTQIHLAAIRAACRSLAAQLQRVETTVDQLDRHDQGEDVLVAARALVALDGIRTTLAKKVSDPLQDLLVEAIDAAKTNG